MCCAAPPEQGQVSGGTSSAMAAEALSERYLDLRALLKLLTRLTQAEWAEVEGGGGGVVPLAAGAAGQDLVADVAEVRGAVGDEGAVSAAGDDHAVAEETVEGVLDGDAAGLEAIDELGAGGQSGAGGELARDDLLAKGGEDEPALRRRATETGNRVGFKSRVGNHDGSYLGVQGLEAEQGQVSIL